jgi:hypothetical protein
MDYSLEELLKRVVESVNAFNFDKKLKEFNKENEEFRKELEEQLNAGTITEEEFNKELAERTLREGKIINYQQTHPEEFISAEIDFDDMDEVEELKRKIDKEAENLDVNLRSYPVYKELEEAIAKQKEEKKELEKESKDFGIEIPEEELQALVEASDLRSSRELLVQKDHLVEFKKGSYNFKKWWKRTKENILNYSDDDTIKGNIERIEEMSKSFKINENDLGASFTGNVKKWEKEIDRLEKRVKAYRKSTDAGKNSDLAPAKCEKYESTLANYKVLFALNGFLKDKGKLSELSTQDKAKIKLAYEHAATVYTGDIPLEFKEVSDFLDKLTNEKKSAPKPEPVKTETKETTKTLEELKNEEIAKIQNSGNLTPEQKAEEIAKIEEKFSKKHKTNDKELDKLNKEIAGINAMQFLDEKDKKEIIEKMKANYNARNNKNEKKLEEPIKESEEPTKSGPTDEEILNTIQNNVDKYVNTFGEATETDLKNFIVLAKQRGLETQPKFVTAMDTLEKGIISNIDNMTKEYVEKFKKDNYVDTELAIKVSDLVNNLEEFGFNSEKILKKIDKITAEMKEISDKKEQISIELINRYENDFNSLIKNPDQTKFDENVKLYEQNKHNILDGDKKDYISSLIKKCEVELANKTSKEQTASMPNVVTEDKIDPSEKSTENKPNIPQSNFEVVKSMIENSMYGYKREKDLNENTLTAAEIYYDSVKSKLSALEQTELERMFEGAKETVSNFVETNEVVLNQIETMFKSVYHDVTDARAYDELVEYLNANKKNLNLEQIESLRKELDSIKGASVVAQDELHADYETVETVEGKTR